MKIHIAVGKQISGPLRMCVHLPAKLRELIFSKITFRIIEINRDLFLCEFKTKISLLCGIQKFCFSIFAFCMKNIY